jgi:hypothetical protein
MFKSKIEKRTKEEFKLEIDKWIDFITSKGFSHQIYKPPNSNMRKNSKIEEESLKHGIQKLEFKEENIVQAKGKVTLAKEFLKRFQFKHFKETLLFLICLIIVSLLIVLIFKINNMLSVLYNNSVELAEIKNLVIERNNNCGNISQVNSNDVQRGNSVF